MIRTLSCRYCDAPMEIVTDGRDEIGEGWIAWAHCPRCGSRGPASSFHRFGSDGGAKKRAEAEAWEHAKRTPTVGG